MTLFSIAKQSSLFEGTASDRSMRQKHICPHQSKEKGLRTLGKQREIKSTRERESAHYECSYDLNQ